MSHIANDLTSRNTAVGGRPPSQCTGSHIGRATVLGRRKCYASRMTLHLATRRSGTTALPIHGFALREGDRPHPSLKLRGTGRSPKMSHIANDLTSRNTAVGDDRPPNARVRIAGGRPVPPSLKLWGTSLVAEMSPDVNVIRCHLLSELETVRVAIKHFPSATPGHSGTV
jgi:hypothetical protein